MGGALEARVIRRISWRIIPFIMLLHFVAFIDRVNIGFAALTMNNDLGFSSSVFGFGAGVFFFLYLTDRPETAKWLPVDERTWLVAQMEAERSQKQRAAKHGLPSGLVDIRVLALAPIYVGTSAGLYTLGIRAPQIIKGFGLSTMAVGALNAVPPTIAIVAMILWARHSDRTGERTWHVVIACLVAAAGLALAGDAASAPAVIAALSLVNVGIGAAKPPLWAMPTMFLSGSAAAAGIAVINSIGNLGGFVGPWVIRWIRDRTGSFAGGLAFVAGLVVPSAVLTLVAARSGRGTEPVGAVSR